MYKIYIYAYHTPNIYLYSISFKSVTCLDWSHIIHETHTQTCYLAAHITRTLCTIALSQSCIHRHLDSDVAPRTYVSTQKQTLPDAHTHTHTQALLLVHNDAHACTHNMRTHTRTHTCTYTKATTLIHYSYDMFGWRYDWIGAPTLGKTHTTTNIVAHIAHTHHRLITVLKNPLTHAQIEHSTTYVLRITFTHMCRRCLHLHVASSHTCTHTNNPYHMHTHTLTHKPPIHNDAHTCAHTTCIHTCTCTLTLLSTSTLYPSPQAHTYTCKHLVRLWAVSR